MSKSLKDLVYQFRVKLVGIEPIVWRRIQVPAKFSFWDLHVAIQDAMGWLDYHLHVYRVTKAAKQGSTKAQFYLGVLHENGNESEKVSEKYNLD